MEVLKSYELKYNNYVQQVHNVRHVHNVRQVHNVKLNSYVQTGIDLKAPGTHGMHV